MQHQIIYLILLYKNVIILYYIQSFHLLFSLSIMFLRFIHVARSSLFSL